jgi:hypothetical protein
VNLHHLASGMVRTVNPNVPVSIQVSTGQSTLSGGKVVPTYAFPIVHYAQVQPLSQKDLQLADSLNLQGTLRAIYMNGNVDGEVRIALKGGDLITINPGGPNPGIYLVTHVEEAWPDWCKALCTLQNGA